MTRYELKIALSDRGFDVSDVRMAWWHGRKRVVIVTSDLSKTEQIKQAVREIAPEVYTVYVDS